jgi:hypothetical protein
MRAHQCAKGEGGASNDHAAPPRIGTLPCCHDASSLLSYCDAPTGTLELRVNSAHWTAISPDRFLACRSGTLPTDHGCGQGGPAPGTGNGIDPSAPPAIKSMSAGPLDPFNHAVSFVVDCEDQGQSVCLMR